jgi:uncharacterized protein (DUF4415 family)
MPRKAKEPVVDRDNPEWTKKDFARATKHPGGIPLAKLAEQIVRKRGRPKLDRPKELVTLRLDADVVQTYRKTGAGWQTMINDDLRKAAGVKDKVRKRLAD